MVSELAFCLCIIQLAALLSLVDVPEILFIMVLDLSLTLILGVLEQTLFLNYLFTKTASAV